MDERLLRIEEKIDRMVEYQFSMGADVKEHIRRTEIAESNIDKISSALAPIQEHVAFIRSLGKIISGTLTFLGSAVAIWRLLIRK